MTIIIVVLFIHIFIIHISIIHAQTSISQRVSIPPDEIITIPINIRPAEKGIFTKQTFQLSVSPPTNVLAQLSITTSPPHSGNHAPLISAKVSSEPSQPSVTSPCSQSQPCIEDVFDKVAFYTRADIASIMLPTTDSKVFVTVYNWKFPGLPNKNLVGTLYIRTVQTSPVGCPGEANRAVCKNRGSCGEDETSCSCERGWGGRSCGTRLEEAPSIGERPKWEGKIEAMRDSAIVRIPSDGVTYVWRIDGSRSRVEFRARVLRGDIVVDGERKKVDGGGGRFEMIVKRAYENLGNGLEEGTRLPTLYDSKGVGKVIVKRGGIYEVVVVGEGVGNWLMGLVVDDVGEAVISVSARRCGQDGLLDCTVSGNDDGFAVGGVVGITIGGIVILIMVLGICVFWVKKRGDLVEQKSISGAWTDVDFRQIDAVQEEEGRNGS